MIINFKISLGYVIVIYFLGGKEGRIKSFFLFLQLLKIQSSLGYERIFYFIYREIYIDRREIKKGKVR